MFPLECFFAQIDTFKLEDAYLKKNGTTYHENQDRLGDKPEHFALILFISVNIHF